MTYKIKSLAYLVAFVAIAYTYQIKESQTEKNSYTNNTELIENNSISTTNIEALNRE